MHETSRFYKAIGIIAVAALLLAAVPMGQVAAQADGVTPALQSGADRLLELQNDDGGWDWPLDDGDPTTSTSMNIIGPITKGLAEVYKVTGDPDQLAALEDAGSFLLTKTNYFSPPDGYLAAVLDEIFGGTTYRDFVTANFYGPLAEGTYNHKGAGTLYTTATYIDYVQDVRSDSNLGLWDIGMGLVGAAACGADTTEWIQGVKDELNEFDGTLEWDVLGLAGALYGLSYVDVDFDPTTGGLESASNLADMAAILATFQITSGGFAYSSQNLAEGGEAVQETAIAILALNEVDRGSFISEIQSAAGYLMDVQFANGGWDGGEGENNEVTGEALWALTVAYPQLWVCETGDCGHPGLQYTSIQDAVDAVGDGGTVFVMPGTYNEQLELRTPNVTVQSTDGRDVTILDIPDGQLTTGVKVLANMGSVTFDGFTVTDFTEGGIIQGMSARPGTSFHVLNNKIIPAADYLRNGIQVSGDGSTVKGNFVEGAYLTEDWASTAIGVVNASNVLVEANEISGAVNGIDYGISVYNWNVDSVQNVSVINNTIYNVDYPLDVTAYHGTVSDVTMEYNKVTNYVEALWAEPYNEGSYDGISVTNVDASPNWWGSATGPLSEIFGQDVTFTPWCGDEACTFTVPDENGVINVPGGIVLNQPNMTYVLKDGTIIQNDSPCFRIEADNITIKAESNLGATCVATGGSSGIEVADGVTGVTIQGLEITDDDVSSGSHGIEFKGAITNLQIVDNFIHGLPASGISFAQQPQWEPNSFYIQGNLIKDNGTAMDNSALTAEINAEYNAWGDNAGTGALTNVDADPWTHVDIYIESTGSPWANQVVNGETITFAVKANMKNIMTAAFELSYPTDLLANPVIGDETALFSAVPGKNLVTTSSGVIALDAYATSAVSGEDMTLFTVTFDAVDTGSGALALNEASALFSMFPGYGPSVNVYADALVNGSVNVIELPTLESDDIQGYYLTGEPRDFNVRTLNPADGAEYSQVLFRYTITGADLTDIQSFTYAGGDMPLAEDGSGNLVGYFGPVDGFAMNNDPYDETTTFNIDFNTAKNYDFELELVDLTTSPETVLVTLTDTAKVYDAPTLTPDIPATFMSGEEVEFLVNLANPATGIDTNVYAEIVLEGLVPDDIQSLQYYEVADSQWHDLPYTTVGGNISIHFGPAEGFPMSASYDQDAQFKVIFDTDVNIIDFTYSGALYDADFDPDRVLASLPTGISTVYANFDLTGTVSMQGRTVRSGVEVMLDGSYVDYSDTSLNLLGSNFGFADVIADTYLVTTSQPRYLNVTVDLDKQFVVSGDAMIPALELKGGNAIEEGDNIIDLADAGVVASQYQQSTFDNGDVNFDNHVNIQDLALVGGNYNLTSADVYADWLPTVP